MAALRRAFQVIGDPTIEGIPEDQLEQLWQLRKLYARKIPWIDMLDSHAPDMNNQDMGHMTASDAEGPAQAPATSSATSAPAQPNTGAFVDNRDQRYDSLASKASLRRSSTAKSTITSTIFRDARSPRLRKFGSGASTEINIQRYLTMLKS